MSAFQAASNSSTALNSEGNVTTSNYPYLTDLSTNGQGDSLVLGRGELVGLDLNSDELNLQQFRHLTHLDLSRNRLNSTTFLRDLPELSRLDLSYNQIKEIDGVLHCSHLECLRVAHNLLVSIPRLEVLPFLRELELNDNHINSIQG
ncbi:unnamed protein product [Echinostoma caproni]|uniref:LRRcap domain-containing protein n=1 Tax=Echinostoma caproni TaxID=27848 RepID=A0A183B4J6_9TREM|nr:unnamed protein product [Echinostoma caproni]